MISKYYGGPTTSLNYVNKLNLQFISLLNVNECQVSLKAAISKLNIEFKSFNLIEILKQILLV